MLGIQHEFAGGIIGLIFGAWLFAQGHPIIAAGCFLISIWGANLPDLLDPPLSPFHRSIGHNFISFFMFLVVFIVGLTLSIIFHWWPLIIVTSFSLAVLSHLVFDMITPMGLPMFVGKSLFGIIEIPLFLIPVINIIMLVVTIILAVYSIRYLAKKIGAKLALLLLFIPVWGSLLLLGIAFSAINWLSWLGYFLLFLFGILIIILIVIGHAIDKSLKKAKRK